jgi:DNA-binding Lrp family transcriptional regulator
MTMAKQLSEGEKQVLAMVQADLPDHPAPFAVMAEKAGLTEEQVLELLQGMKDQGEIRRFGATLRHQKAGYGANAMVAWYVDDEDAARVGEFMAGRPEISHCYQRVNCLDWPYNLYTMVHAKTREQCRQAVQELSRLVGDVEYEVLESRRELKKTSMRYF